jgi:hypothetical protein
LVALEDAPENPFIDNFSFSENHFLVLPGRGEGSTFNLSLVAKVLLSGPDPNGGSARFRELRKRAFRFIYASLIALDSSVQGILGAGIPPDARGTAEITDGSPIRVPSGDTLRRLRKAATIKRDQLSPSLHAHDLQFRDLSPLCISLAEARQITSCSAYDICRAPLRSHPIVELSQNTYVIACPNSFMDAVTGHVWLMAAAMGAAEEFASRMQDAVAGLACRSVVDMGWIPIGTLERNGGGQPDKAFLFGLDLDKAACVIPLACPLSRFPVDASEAEGAERAAANEVAASYIPATLEIELAGLIDQVEILASDQDDPAGELLIVIVIQSL